MPRASGAREPETVMAKSRDPFFKALDNIRERARAGGYAPGQSIVIVEEARRLDLSTTPVREALAWLCGEGLIERGRAGFLPPVSTPARCGIATTSAWPICRPRSI